MDIVDVPVCNVISDVPRTSRSDAGTYFVASAAGAAGWLSIGHSRQTLNQAKDRIKHEITAR